MVVNGQFIISISSIIVVFVCFQQFPSTKKRRQRVRLIFYQLEFKFVCERLALRCHTFAFESQRPLTRLLSRGRGGDLARPMETIVDGLSYSSTYAKFKAVMSKKCAECSYINKISFVAFATKLSGNMKCEHWPNSLHFVMYISTQREVKIRKFL